MPRPRAWIHALFVCCLTGATVIVMVGAIRAASAEASVRVPPPPATSPAPAEPSTKPESSTPATAPASGTPTPQPSNGTGSVDDGSGGCGLFDIGCKAKEAINGFFRGLVTSALNPVFTMMAGSVLATPRVDQIPRIHTLWTTSAWIANTSFVLLVTLAGMLLMGHQSLQTSYAAKDIVPRLFIAMIAANVNLPVIGQAIDFANALSAALIGDGVDPGQAANTLKGLVLSAITDVSGVFMPLLGLAAVVLGLLVLITYTIRVMLLVLLTAAAPLALACHALPQTEGMARLWWRALFGVLAIQAAQALVFATAIRVFFTSDQAGLFVVRSGKGMFDLLLVICLLYILARIPAWISQLVMRGGMGRSPIARTARTLATLMLFGRLAGTRRGAQRPPVPKQPPPSFPVPRPPPPPPPIDPPSWHQPELPFPPPVSGGTQLEFPFNPPLRPRTPRPGWTQLRLPEERNSSPRWQQTSLPIRPRYEQTRLPAPPPRTHVQPELPLRFPPPGSPQAGRSPRRLADQATRRDAETRTRRTPPRRNP